MLLPSNREKMKKSKAEIKELVKDSFKASKFKRIEFQDKGSNPSTVVDKIRKWYFHRSFIINFNTN